MTKPFTELGLSADLLKAIDRLGFEQASPIQAAAIPLLMAGKDIVGQSQTGSGKTAAFGIPAVEAMACETPLVATRAGALPEVVGECAVLVQPGDAGALAAAVADLLDDAPERTRLGVGGRRRVEEQFSWRAVAAATVDVYRDAMELVRAHG